VVGKIFRFSMTLQMNRLFHLYVKQREVLRNAFESFRKSITKKFLPLTSLHRIDDSSEISTFPPFLRSLHTNLVSFPRNFSTRFIHYRDVSSCRFQDLIGLFSWSFACASRSMQHEISLMLDWAERKINRCAFKMLVCGQTIVNVRLHKHVSLILSALSGLRNAICCCRMHFLPYLTIRSAINIIVEYRSEGAKRRTNTFFH
jgi:hypothetical protein